MPTNALFTRRKRLVKSPETPKFCIIIRIKMDPIRAKGVFIRASYFITSVTLFSLNINKMLVMSVLDNISASKMPGSTLVMPNKIYEKKVKNIIFTAIDIIVNFNACSEYFVNSCTVIVDMSLKTTIVKIKRVNKIKISEGIVNGWPEIDRLLRAA
jgi:hypothetical protein